MGIAMHNRGEPGDIVEGKGQVFTALSAPSLTLDVGNSRNDHPANLRGSPQTNASSSVLSDGTIPPAPAP